MHPCVEAIRVAQPANAPPRLDEGILNGVFSAWRVAKNQASDGIEVSDRGARQPRERVDIAIPCLLHEVPHSVTLIGRAIRLVSQGMWDPKRQRVPQWPRTGGVIQEKGRTTPPVSLGLARARIIGRRRPG